MENAAILARIPFTRGREGIAWANNVRPYGIYCADRIQAVRRVGAPYGTTSAIRGCREEYPSQRVARHGYAAPAEMKPHV